MDGGIFINMVSFWRIYQIKIAHGAISFVFGIDPGEMRLSSTLLVIWILDRVHGLIFPVKVYILPSRQARENINFDREYESMYPVENPYNEYVLLQSD